MGIMKKGVPLHHSTIPIPLNQNTQGRWLVVDRKPIYIGGRGGGAFFIPTCMDYLQIIVNNMAATP